MRSSRQQCGDEGTRFNKVLAAQVDPFLPIRNAKTNPKPLTYSRLSWRFRFRMVYRDITARLQRRTDLRDLAIPLQSKCGRSPRHELDAT